MVQEEFHVAPRFSPFKPQPRASTGVCVYVLNGLKLAAEYTGQSLSRFLFHLLQTPTPFFCLLQTPTGKPVLRKSCLHHLLGYSLGGGAIVKGCPNILLVGVGSTCCTSLFHAEVQDFEAFTMSFASLTGAVPW